MKLKKFNTKTKGPHLQRHPIVNVNSKGIFRFNNRAIYDLKLKGGIKINVLQDEESPTDWYLEITKEEAGITVLEKSGKQMIFCSAVAARELIRSLAIAGGKSVAIPIAAEPTEGKYYALITRKVANPVNDL